MTERADGQVTWSDLGLWSGKMCPEHSAATKGETLRQSSKRSSASQNRKPPILKCLKKDGKLGGATTMRWEDDGAWLGECMMRNTGESPNAAVASRLSQILEATPQEKYSLSAKACQGILRRAERRGKDLLETLKAVLLMQSESGGAVTEAEERSPTLNAECGGNKPAVMCLNDQGGNVMGVSHDVAGTLRAQEHGHQPTVLDMSHACDVIRECGEQAPALQARMGTGGNQVPLIYGIGNGQACEASIMAEEIAQTLNTMHDAQAILYQPKSAMEENWAASETKNALRAGESKVSHVVVCEDVSPALRAKANDPYREDMAAYIVSVDCRNFCEGGEINGTLQAKESGGQSLNLNNTVRQNMVVRRLTPMECERLQGFPDHWTDIGEWVDEKGKKHKPSDSPRYKSLGNSIALPFWDWMLRRMARYLPEGATLGSLFDGIGGFPLIWERIHGEGTARWASEIEQFPIAVTKIRFPEEREDGI